MVLVLFPSSVIWITAFSKVGNNGNTSTETRAHYFQVSQLQIPWNCCFKVKIFCPTKKNKVCLLRNVLQHCKCSDWFVLQQMFSNCHHYNSRQIINYLNKYFSSQSRFKTRSYPKFSDENSKKRKEFYDQEEDIYARPPV